MVNRLATVRFETPPAQQLQIDFGCKAVWIGDCKIKVFVFVATLGYSRRNFAQLFLHERQSAWFEGLENAFRYFGGVTREVLVDNPASLVKKHNRETGELLFNERFTAFCHHWGVTPRACAPYRARTKGKDENGVGYVKKNCLAGHRLESFQIWESHLARWLHEIADVRIHGTTGEKPIERFERLERAALQSLAGRPPFQQVREVSRKVANDALVEFETNRYSVPWKYIGESVTVTVVDQMLQVTHAGQLLATHPLCSERQQMIRQTKHFEGIFRSAKTTMSAGLSPTLESDLLRPLLEYEVVAGGPL